jgi:hypothetical protein
MSFNVGLLLHIVLQQTTEFHKSPAEGVTSFFQSRPFARQAKMRLRKTVSMKLLCKISFGYSWQKRLEWEFSKYLCKRNIFSVKQCIIGVTAIYTECPRRNVPDYGRMFLMLNYTDIIQKTYMQSWTVTEIMARDFWNCDRCYTLIDYHIHIETYRNMWFL